VVENPISALQSYDFPAIASYYRRRPWLVLWRTWQILSHFIWFWLGLQWDSFTNWLLQRPESPTQVSRRAEQLRQIITRLGPTYIKVGQALSTRPDLVRADYLEELTKLQDQLPPFANDIAFQIIEAELGKPVEAIYRWISPAPVAAASLGQVYKGELHSGEVVAIKVQRPHLIPTLTLDLFILRTFAELFGDFLPLNLGNSLSAVIDEFGTKLFEEIDYINEGKNADRFAAYFRNDPKVKVPAIYWQYSSRRVLTLEWIDGIKLTETDRIKAAGLNTDEIIKIGVLSGLRQLLEFGFFHADPHPGNLFATYDGRMAYIDFGMMDQLSLETKEHLVDAVVHLINKDYEQLGQVYIKLGFLKPDTDMAPITRALETVLGDIMAEKVKDFNFKVVTDRFSRIMYEYPFCLPAKFALIIRSVVTQEGVALTLNPEFRIVQVAYPYVAKRLLTDESESLRRRLLEVLFRNERFQWHRLENLITIARSDGEFDLIPTAHMGLQYLFSPEGEFIRRRLLLALTEDNRLHLAEIQRLWQLLVPELEPAKLWSAGWQAIAPVVAQFIASVPLLAGAFGNNLRV
jgi:predicted unusual protein kinase regulating ubiquinone biosynthesis (AarF/ABC1/UbiB family)